MIWPILEFRHVAVIWDMRIMVRQDGAWKPFDFGKECGLPSKWMPGLRCGLYAAAYGTVNHAPHQNRTAQMTIHSAEAVIAQYIAQQVTLTIVAACFLSINRPP